MLQIDHSVVESYGGGGRTVITARVYPEHAENRIFMFNNGTSVVKVPKMDAWEMNPAAMNVL
jgi:beta-fructofuranosidase